MSAVDPRLMPLMLLGISLPVAAQDVVATSGFMSGLLHSFQGMDHILAAFSVGMLCTMLEKRVVCLIPLAFMFFMCLGSIAGILNAPLPVGDSFMALGVVALGVVIALNRNMPISFAMALVGVFAVFHGYEHGAAMPADAAPVTYLGGLMISTIMLQLVGILSGKILIVLDKNSRLIRITGGAIAMCGGYLILALLLQVP
ncbi:HupE/UreJ family protein [Shewanella yunxiaonensis]|uniref:HupE/UreJ family protein n=1 Tax=Shewanella yunxiaonensis TaxID=2829809 RepID=A0ABX7YU77_9GAMM|nr:MULTISPECIES: HupE/UreJ family protein [Shewanella]MDF0534979.1 HupE/UreJ family protein [Shewanella sp. A32]QUN06209.1 HupE/UreJ family protein [Shewanella yunxiaonensis]